MVYRKVTWSANGIRMFDLVMYLGIVLVLLCCLAAIIRLKCKGKAKRSRGRNGPNVNQETTLQQEDIFNISSRVQGQDSQWNTRELSQVTISQMQKPPYDDAPPSYEEAMRLAVAASLQTSNTNSSSTQIQSVVVEEPKPVGSTSTSS